MASRQHHRRRRRERAIAGITDTIQRLTRELAGTTDKEKKKLLQSHIAKHEDVITRTTVNLQ